MNADIKEFLEIEKKYDLYHLEVFGIQCWQYVRFKLWNHEICTEQFGLVFAEAKQGKTEIALKVIGSLFYILFHPEKRKLHQADVCFIAHERRIKNQDCYECIYTDRLAKAYYPRVISLEKTFKMKHMRPAKTKNLYYTDLISIKGNLECYLQMFLKSGRYKRVRQEVHRLFREPIDEIIRKFHLNTQAEEIEEWLIKATLEVQALRRFYAKILDKIQPKIIVEVVGYSKMCMVINELAKKRGIATAELQHGIMHSDHAAYHYADGCGLIPQFPQILFAFSDYWKRCADLPIKDAMIKVVGYPYFEQKLKQYPKSLKDGKKTILFISQGTIGKELSNLAAKIAKMLPLDKYHIIYKLHPEEFTYWRERYSCLLGGEIEVAGSFECSIYEYFAVSDIQVGVYSTAIFEGLGFGLRTFIYRIGYARTMEELCRQGYADFVEDAAELVKLIGNETMQGEISPELFWKRNALENIKAEIDRYI